MQGSFLRVEDWAPTHLHANNQSWKQLLSIIDEFEHLIDTQKKEIIDCVKELTIRRIQAVKSYYKFKTCLKLHGEFKKEQVNVYEGEKVRYFFHEDFQTVELVVQALAKNPKALAKILHEQSAHKLEQTDFPQNLLFCLYPCYVPSIISDGLPNRSLLFIEAVINHWNYSIKAGRPETYTVLDQIINGFNKTPEMVCYVEKISITFMQNINKCKMDFFAFDEQAITHELQIKRQMAMTQNSPPTRSRWNKLKSFFKNSKEEDYAESFYSVTSDLSDQSDLDISAADIMKSRQKDFATVVINTVQQILQLETPYLLNVLFRFFHNKVSLKLAEANEGKVGSLNQSIIVTNEPLNSSIVESLVGKKGGVLITDARKESNPHYNKIFRHYCYFLMINLVFEELHSKFIIAHQDSGMTPADLQNITEIIRIMTHIFQGHLPEGEKYKNTKVFAELQDFLPRIPAFYANILKKTEHLDKFSSSKMAYIEELMFAEGQTQKQQHKKEESIKQILLKMHENTIVLSFDDIRVLLHTAKKSKIFAKQLNMDPSLLSLDFLETKKIYQKATRTVSFDNVKHEVDKVLFVFTGSSPSLLEVAQYYSGSDNPLKNMPALTKALMYGSNLTVSEALQVTKSLQLIQNLPLKEMKYYLSKLSQRYSNLYLRDNELISRHFRATIEQHLTHNIHRKATLLLHRDDICSRVDYMQKLINFYTEELQSSQFYSRISHVFIQNIKIKLYMRIENDELQIYKAINDMKGVHLQSILMTDTDPKGKKFSDQYLLRNSFKTFSNIRDFLRCLVKNNITRSAINCGRRVDEFNEVFSKACNIIVSYIQEFMAKRELLKNLNKERLARTIVSNLQNHIYEKCKSQGALEDDQALGEAKKGINKYLFYQKELAMLEVDWEFLTQEGVQKFKLMQEQTSIYERIRHFEELFKMVFTIVGFTIPKNKISAEIINPIMQYLILLSENTRHYDCLYSLQCLKWNASPETHYNIILYQSSLVYVTKMMGKDHPL